MQERSTIRSYKDLEVWQVAMDLAVACYRATRALPESEVYGLISQIRRASVAVPANVAEGYGRETTGSFVQFLRIAQGSIKELETHVLLTERLGLLATNQAGALLHECERVSKMLRNFIRALQERK